MAMMSSSGAKRSCERQAVGPTGGWSGWKHGPGPTPTQCPDAAGPASEPPWGDTEGGDRAWGGDRQPAGSGIRSVPPHRLMCVRHGTRPRQGPCRPGGTVCGGSRSRDPGCPPSLPALRRPSAGRCCAASVAEHEGLAAGTWGGWGGAPRSPGRRIPGRCGVHRGPHVPESRCVGSRDAVLSG